MRPHCSLSGTFGALRPLLTTPKRASLRHRARLALLGTLMLLFFLPARAGQQDPMDLDQSDRAHDPFHHRADMTQAVTYKRIEQWNVQRQREMTSQTTRLLQLATELNASSSHPAPSDIQKADTIAKLAHSVRQAMGNSINPNLSLR